MERHMEPLTEPWSTAGSADGRPGGASSLKSLTQRLLAGLFLARARVVGGRASFTRAGKEDRLRNSMTLGACLAYTPLSLGNKNHCARLLLAPPPFSTDSFIPSKEFFIAVALPKPNHQPISTCKEL